MTTRFMRVVTLTGPHMGAFFIFLALFFGVLFLPVDIVYAKHERSVPLTIFNQDGTEVRSFPVPLKNDTGGATVALGDVVGDEQPEIIIGNGYGNEPQVRYFGMDGKELSHFSAYESDMQLGITVAACDIDGDGVAEVITGKQPGGDPEVRVYTKEGRPLPDGSFMAYDAAFEGGVFVACGDTDGDGVDEVVTAPGPTGGPHIRVWQFTRESGVAEEILPPQPAPELPLVADSSIVPPSPPDIQKFAFRNPNRPDDLSARHWGLAMGTVTVAAEQTKPAWTIRREYFDGDPGDTRGRLVSVVREGGRDIVVTEPVLGQHAYERMVHSTQYDITGDGTTERITIPGNYLEADPNKPKEVVVDLSDQRLYMYEYGALKRSFFVSTGLYAYPTPTGSFALEKVPSVLYSAYYGPGNPGNYDYGWVANNLRIKPHYFIHTAYWHNDFGHRRSHGCVNVEKSNNDLIYAWADDGTPLTIRN
ncbi:MAG: L,D-transpeptidase [Candidatus Magasanikbacteria bacterium]|nr:L,D-transpeptidase [Candidatus Magasanikbacteria bacterium]